MTIKQSFNFDGNVLPPASAPFRRGLASGVLISLPLIVVASVAVALEPKLGHIGHFAFMTLGFVGLPWTGLFPIDSFFALSLCILVNGLILGIIIGVINVIRNRKKVLTIVSPQ